MRGKISRVGVLSSRCAVVKYRRDRPVRADPEEGHKNDLRDGTPLLQGQAERAGAFQPGKEKAVR